MQEESVTLHARSPFFDIRTTIFDSRTKANGRWHSNKIVELEKH